MPMLLDKEQNWEGKDRSMLMDMKHDLELGTPMCEGKLRLQKGKKIQEEELLLISLVGSLKEQNYSQLRVHSYTLELEKYS